MRNHAASDEPTSFSFVPLIWSARADGDGDGDRARRLQQQRTRWLCDRVELWFFDGQRLGTERGSDSARRGDAITRRSTKRGI
jgi:hypothetical protein